jgi:hypothetical protein
MCCVIVYARQAPDATPGLTGMMATAVLAGTMLLGLFWELRVVREPQHLLLAQTTVVVSTALGLTLWGHVGGRRPALSCGLGCMGLALAKLLLVDLIRLKSAYMLTSLILVGLASVGVSIILRRRP